MEKYKVSFIVPVYNVEKYIGECLESILNQSIDSKEIIIINDGCTDKSAQICQKYCENYDFIKMIMKENGGLSSARNVGIQHSRGEYIFFVDSDDFLLEDRVSEIYDYCKKESLDIIRCEYTRYDEVKDKLFENQKEEKKYFGKVLSGLEFLKAEINEDTYEVIACLGLFRTEYLRKHNIKFREGVTYEDHEFFLKCLLCSKKNRIVKKNILIYAYRDRVGSITKTPKIKNIYDMVKNTQDMKSYIEHLNLNTRERNIAYIPVSVIFNHLISLYIRLPKSDKTNIYTYIKKNIKFKDVCKSYNYRQLIKIILFFYIPKVYEYIYKKKGVN